MRFFEYEAREIVKRAGIPVTDYGFATTPQEAREVAATHPDHVGRGHFSNLLPLSDYRAKEVIASVGISGAQLNRLVPILTRLAELFVAHDMTLAEINPLGELEDGSFVALDAHMEMEN